MSKVICDICGTAYPSSAQSCPICGSSREYALENPEEEISLETEDFAAAPKKNREIFDYDEVNARRPSVQTMDSDDFDDEEPVYEEEPRTNVGLVIVLVILIALLLLATGFFFLRYMLPNMREKTPETTVATQPIATEPVETTEATIPCTNLMMDGGKMELGRDGKKLLNVRVYPENTTDTLTYTSGDESVVTINGSGTVTAVGEGQTVITVQCGSQMIKCNVTVDYSIGEETVPTGELPAMQVQEGEADPSEGTEAPTEGTQVTEGTQATEETEAATETTPADASLKLKKTDLTLSMGMSTTLELEGDLKPEDVTWFTMDSTVAIVHNGLVTALGRGITRIYAEYNGQQVYCIIRCN